MARTILYCWKEKDDLPKFGDHYIEDDNVDWVKETTAYIRSSLSRQKHKYDLGKIDILWIKDVTDKAVEDGKSYSHAKYDDFVAKATKLNQHKIVTPGKKYRGDVYNIDSDELTRRINSYIEGTFALDSYKSHQFQNAARDQAVTYFNNNGTDFLLDAVMRFGKCHTSYLICKELKAKRILVITGRPKVKNGWSNDLDHVYFGWKFRDTQIEKDIEFSGNEPEVVFASFQGAKRVNLASRLAKVSQQQIDMVIIDEFHAYYSADAKKFIEALDCKRRLWVSGTPFKAYEEGRFNGITDTYRFTMLDALKAKRAGMPRFVDFPEPLILVSEWSKEVTEREVGAEELNMAKLLSNNKGAINYPQEVSALLNTLIDTNKSSAQSAFLAGAREGVKTAHTRTHDHLWFAVPRGKDDSREHSVASADTIMTAFKSHNVFSTYHALKVGGDVGGDELSVQQWHNNFDKTAVLSAGALNTGTTLPKLDTLIYLKESDSAAEFWQTFGRVMNPLNGKEVVTIVLPGPEFYSNMMAKMVEYSSSSSNFTQVFTEAISLMPAFLIGGPKPVAVDIDVAFSLLSTEGSIRKSFKDSSALSYNIDSLISQYQNEIDGLPDMNSGTDPAYLNSQFKSGKNTKQTRTAVPKAKNAFNPNEIKTRIRVFNTTIPNIVALTRAVNNVKIESVSDLQLVDDELINDEMGVNAKQWINFLFDKGFLNKAVIEKKIAMFNKFEVDPLCK